MPPMMNGRTRNKEKGDLKSLNKLFKYTKKYHIAIIVAFVCAIVSAVCTIIGPSFLSDLTNVIQAGLMGKDIDMSEVTRLSITLLSLYSLGAIIAFVQQFIMATVTQRTANCLRSDINKKINTLPLAFFDSSSTGDVLSIVTNDVDTISQTLSSSIANFVSAVVLFFGVIIMMFVKNWILALTVILSSVIGFMLMGLILSKSQVYFNRKQEYLGKMNGHIEEIYTNHNVVKAYNSVENEKTKFDTFNEGLYINNWKSQFLSGLMMPLMGFIGNFSYVMIFIVGVAISISSPSFLKFGTIIAFTIYARLFNQPLNTISQSMTNLQQASAASKRVFNILQMQDMENEDGKISHIDSVKGNIDFENVSFRYLEDKPIINNFSVSIKSGQKVAIVGPTGAGKTTIVNLLMRFYDINSGTIKIDGISTKDMRRECVHDMFDMILQDTWLFNGTLRENLAYNKTGVSDDDLLRVCKAVGLSHLVESLPNGLDTVLDEKASLSEGQKQQLTIARAMIKDAPLLILDEATSNVDTRTELIIQNAMDKLTENRTSFVIAHRLSTIKNANIILVINHGDIVEMGNHQELLAKNGFYADLYNSQFQSFGNE